MPNHMSPFGGLLLLAATSSLSIAVAAITAAPAAAQQATRYFDIASMPLADAVLEYSRQAQRPVLAPMELMQGKMAPAVQGQMTPDAITRLLAGSGLRAVTGQSGGLTLVADTAGGTAVGEFAAGRGPAASASAEGKFEAIVVTGSHIRGQDKPVGSHLIMINREEIQRSGFSTVRDLTESLPQNFGSGATGEYQLNFDSAGNNAQGTTFNLRGLGQTATLSLINGRRVPTGGTQVSVSNISTVPLAAVERVEVLPDGVSAVYGSDAFAGVVNIILRRD